MVNKILTILALALLPIAAQAATAGLPVTVAILNPTARIDALPERNKRPRPGFTLQGQSGQVIRYVVGAFSGTIILDADGMGQIILPKAVATDAEYILHYD
jgi:hypothetical protein